MLGAIKYRNETQRYHHNATNQEYQRCNHNTLPATDSLGDRERQEGSKESTGLESRDNVALEGVQSMSFFVE
jgi:hypothetical protein